MQFSANLTGGGGSLFVCIIFNRVVGFSPEVASIETGIIGQTPQKVCQTRSVFREAISHDVYVGVIGSYGAVVASSQNYRNDVPPKNFPEFLRGIIPTDGVLEGQVEHVVVRDVIPAIPTLVLSTFQTI